MTADRARQVSAVIATAQLLERETVRALPQRVARRIATGAAADEAVRVECQRTAGELARINATMQAACAALLATEDAPGDAE